MKALPYRLQPHFDATFITFASLMSSQGKKRSVVALMMASMPLSNYGSQPGKEYIVHTFFSTQDNYKRDTLNGYC